ncbi:MAG: hypothetical protein Q4B40_01730 [Clostridia bacterium]|nr:hypothetical protein [Clostridia bacterium]
MISLIPIKDKEQIADFFKKHNLVPDEFSGCVTATEKDSVIGYCLYRLDSKTMTVFAVEPQNDIMLADGILRSALHVSAENFVLDAFYDDTAPVDLFKKLDFIKNAEQKTLNIDKLFGGCGCKKQNKEKKT